MIRVHFSHAKMWVSVANQRGYKVNVMAYDIPNDTAIDLDAFVTPEEAEDTKRIMKELSVRAGRCPLRSDRQSQSISTRSNQDVSRMIPFSAVHLLEKSIDYELDTSKAIDDERMSPTATLDLSNAHSLASDIGQRYVESLVLFGSFWFLITSVDVFLHGTPTIDDCAHNGGWNYENSVQASIVSKSHLGHSKYYELSLSLGNVELLAVGGFYGHTDHATTSAFLGSSLKGLPEQINGSASTSRILIRKIPAISTTSNRHIRQYAKTSAAASWSTHSFRFSVKGFFPVNPLSFGDHPVTRNGLGGPTSQLASLVLRCIAEQKVTNEQMDIMITKVLTDSKIKAMMKDAEVVTFAKIFVEMSKKSHGVTQYMKAVVGVAKLLEERLNDHENGTARVQQLADFSSHALEIFRRGFLERLAGANLAGVKAYTKKHCYEIDI
ncbi:hypothetical protein RO3G_12430 [Lichtheimia corymbifera JMRC:FSU:9682]|uniref:Uncharacterized protein n=1 Tax=Lichtheimia corymbifera JMRC:FSU:9682 TaxID=1263082 RepID=A0A068SFC3_9FUNG|nr:hypothetical protein RO3G_12430 [Lichtheimia corymbifera JMRC:FSU:9682]